jgi:hypothetical protein
VEHNRERVRAFARSQHADLPLRAVTRVMARQWANSTRAP